MPVKRRIGVAEGVATAHAVRVCLTYISKFTPPHVLKAFAHWSRCVLDRRMCSKEGVFTLFRCTLNAKWAEPEIKKCYHTNMAHLCMRDSERIF